jgi:hypothetical protein
MPEFNAYEGLGQILVARRAAVATLIETALVNKGNFEWSKAEFGRYLNKKFSGSAPQHLAKVINFNDELRLHSHRSEKLLRLLFSEEYEWLLEQGFDDEKKHILARFRRAVFPELKRTSAGARIQLPNAARLGPSKREPRTGAARGKERS